MGTAGQINVEQEVAPVPGAIVKSESEQPRHPNRRHSGKPRGTGDSIEAIDSVHAIDLVTSVDDGIGETLDLTADEEAIAELHDVPEADSLPEADGLPEALTADADNPSEEGIAAKDAEAFIAAKRIGDRIKYLRQRKGMGLVELGRYTGLSASFLSQLETGRVVPTLRNLARLAMVFSKT